MKTPVLPPLSAAIAPLLAGKVVIIPTDTVYGFSCLADDFDSDFTSIDDFDSGEFSDSHAKKIFALKGRAENKPFIRLVPDAETILRYAAQEIPPAILDLLPAPLTLIVKTGKNECGLETTAFRCPADRNLRALLAQTGMLYSSSVNKSGCRPLTSIEEIRREFSDSVDIIIDATVDTGAGTPSTIADITGGTPRIVRQGAFVFPQM